MLPVSRRILQQDCSSGKGEFEEALNRSESERRPIPIIKTDWSGERPRQAESLGELHDTKKIGGRAQRGALSETSLPPM
jgi:hypothetical protein